MKQVIEKLFGFDFQKHHVRTEIYAGITTFLTMAYILAVNPSIFSALPEMPGGSVFTATALAAVVGTLVMAIYAKKPFAIAPGMGMNAFFVFTVCLAMEYHLCRECCWYGRRWTNRIDSFHHSHLLCTRFVLLSAVPGYPGCCYGSCPDYCGYDDDALARWH